MNPFEKRATEYIRDDMAFLPYVTPEPLITYLEKYAERDVLFDRLAVLVGSPGSGKTTLARLFCLPTVATMLRGQSTRDQWKSLFDALRRCQAVSGTGAPLVAGCRIPLESDYRECWELPYDEPVRHKLMQSLLQARTVLAWFRAFEAAGIPVNTVHVVPRADAEAALEAIGGTSPEKMREVARTVERDVYKVTAGLIPPAQDQLPKGAVDAYDPFDVIEAFEIQHGDQTLRLKPLVICDDAHVLHPKQFDGLVKWMARREVRVARWMLTRIDALRPQAVLRPTESLAQDTSSGLNYSRDMVVIWMQAKEDRAANRKAFRRMARDMSERYLEQMSVFSRRRFHSLENMLGAEAVLLPPGKLKHLEESMTAGRRRQVGADRRADIERQVDEYLLRRQGEAGPSEGPEVRLMMVRILMERYLNRVPQSSLFGDAIEVDPSVPLKVDSTIRDAAYMQLFQEYELPFFYGFDMLCDSASENAERFLRLAGHLVAQLETMLIRGSEPKLTSAMQEKLLRDRAKKMLDDEDLPDRTRVLRLCEVMASQCLERTREPNASLGEGPNAWGIRQAEFDAIPETHPVLARVIQSGVAYNMFTLVRDHSTKNERWCLIELSGTWSLHKGLTLRRGGFLERRARDLAEAAQSADGPEKKSDAS